MEKLKMEERTPKWFKPAAYNPRVELQPGDPEYESLKKSIEQFGCVDPIVANKDGTIIGGHQRFRVLCDLGYEKIPVVILDKSKNEEKALNIALNKIEGEWDEPKLVALIGEINTSSLDASVTGFSMDEIKEMVGSVDTSVIDSNPGGGAVS